MECPFYEEITVRYCKALAKRIMIPAGSEKERFCTCKKYRDCPLFQEFIKEKGTHKKLLNNQKGAQDGDRPEED
jgi:hypothetical protein